MILTTVKMTASEATGCSYTVTVAVVELC